MDTFTLTLTDGLEYNIIKLESFDFETVLPVIDLKLFPGIQTDYNVYTQESFDFEIFTGDGMDFERIKTYTLSYTLFKCHKIKNIFV